MASVSSSEAAAGTKRSVVEEAPVMVSAGGPVADRPDKRPRLNETHENNNSETSELKPEGSGSSGAVALDAEGIVGNIGDIDIMCRIACFMDTGQGLMNACISVGRRDAAKIRNKYLLKNDAYLVKLLRRLSAIRDMGYWEAFHASISAFDKCRDCVTAWMVVNKDWKKRCTPEKIEKYKHDPLPFVADVIFNNPVVAAEIGLLDVVKFLVETRRVNINGSFWHHFGSHGFEEDSNYHLTKQHLVHVVLVRGDVELLQYLLSVDGLDLENMIDEDYFYEDNLQNTIEFGIIRPYVSDECFRCLITHPNVDVNYFDGMSALRRTIITYVHENHPEHRRVILSRMRIIFENGGDPRIPFFPLDQTCIDYVREISQSHQSSKMRLRWNELLDMLERAAP